MKINKHEARLRRAQCAARVPLCEGDFDGFSLLFPGAPAGGAADRLQLGPPAGRQQGPAETEALPGKTTTGIKTL